MSGIFKYHIFVVPPREQYAFLEQETKGLAEPWLLGEGARLGDGFPSNARYPISKTKPGMKLADFIANKFGQLFVSGRARQVLEREPVDIEWLPVVLLDKKDGVVDAPCFIANVVGRVDCVDLAQSEYDRSSFEPDEFLAVRRLVLDVSRIPETASLFRIKEQPGTFIIRSDLVDRLADAGVKGFSLLELGAPVFL
ncbi:imm11 family protein [Pyxidicoccus sp. MSG2]|uniref:imm11 family protein n=1 Tax=Pyxidicoccus sp. MSG2 TaxID=2996790 RepID=UPI00226D7DAF|nr:DUF1629 domain-containing protein [Pyxidicoccus sp. MSG2]MCY1021677.1 hypothetical protein [Pyxidicoccus sp. MSG2]